MQKNDYGGHGGDLLAAARQFRRQPAAFIDFSSNINPLGPPQGLIEHLRQRLPEITRYPVPGAVMLRRGLAERFSLPEERLLVGNGANELIHLLFLYLRPKTVLLPVPTFAEYARAAHLAGALVRPLRRLPDMPPDCSAMYRELHGADFLVLCNPNNPTGELYPPDTLTELFAAAVRQKVTVLVDESFFPFTALPPGRSSAALDLENLWVVTSLTKIWALPGLRLGVLAGPAPALKNLSTFGDPWRVNSMAQLAGLYCLQHAEYEKKSAAAVKRERAFLAARLARLPGLTVFSGQSNFLLLRGEEPGFQAATLYRFLGHRGILIRVADNFTGLDHRYFRIAVRLRRENRLLLEALTEYFTTAQEER
ncbi:MAG: threonine-phosphate decarboxylase CobD [Bacillota bacterium]